MASRSKIRATKSFPLGIIPTLKHFDKRLHDSKIVSPITRGAISWGEGGEAYNDVKRGNNFLAYRPTRGWITHRAGVVSSWAKELWIWSDSGPFHRLPPRAAVFCLWPYGNVIRKCVCARPDLVTGNVFDPCPSGWQDSSKLLFHHSFSYVYLH